MSFNLDRRVRREQMKAMIKEFKKENSLSSKAFYDQLFPNRKGLYKVTLGTTFAMMIDKASKAFDEEQNGRS